jgi:hypothetical protein
MITGQNMIRFALWVAQSEAADLDAADPRYVSYPGHGEAAHLARSCAARWSLSWRCASPRTQTLCLRRVRCRSRGPCATRKCKMGRERALSLLLSQTIRRKPFKPANRALANDMLPR